MAGLIIAIILIIMALTIGIWPTIGVVILGVLIFNLIAA